MLSFSLIKDWFVEYFKFCPLRRRNQNSEPLLIIGHRGSPTVEVENTIASLARSVEEGANGIEIDISITKDGIPILWHDWDPNDTVTLLREAGLEPFVKYKPFPPPLGSDWRKPCNELTFDEMQKHYDFKERKKNSHTGVNVKIATLYDFFDWTDKHNLKYVFFDIKAPADDKEDSIRILQCIHDLMKEHQSKFIPVMETCDKEVLETMRSNFPGFNYSLDIEPPIGIVLNPEEYSSVKAAIECKTKYAISLRPRKVTIANWTTYRRIIRYDIVYKNEHNNNDADVKISKAVAATVCKKNELKCLLRMGIDGIQTDYPERLAKLAKRFKREIA